MSDTAGIPPALDTDAEDVAWALQTAEALWSRGDRVDAVVWLRRAAQSAGDAHDDGRAVALARMAADLSDWIARQSAVPVSPGAGRPGEDYSVDALLSASEVDVTIDVDVPSMAPPATGASAHPELPTIQPEAIDLQSVPPSSNTAPLPPGMPGVVRPAVPPAPAPPRVSPPSAPPAAGQFTSLPPGVDAPDARPAAEAHAGMFDPWAEPEASTVQREVPSFPTEVDGERPSIEVVTSADRLSSVTSPQSPTLDLPSGAAGDDAIHDAVTAPPKASRAGSSQPPPAQAAPRMRPVTPSTVDIESIDIPTIDIAPPSADATAAYKRPPTPSGTPPSAEVPTFRPVEQPRAIAPAPVAPPKPVPPAAPPEPVPPVASAPPAAPAEPHFPAPSPPGAPSLADGPTAPPAAVVPMHPGSVPPRPAAKPLSVPAAPAARPASAPPAPAARPGSSPPAPAGRPHSAPPMPAARPASSPPPARVAVAPPVAPPAVPPPAVPPPVKPSAPRIASGSSPRLPVPTPPSVRAVSVHGASDFSAAPALPSEEPAPSAPELDEPPTRTRAVSAPSTQEVAVPHLASGVGAADEIDLSTVDAFADMDPADRNALARSGELVELEQDEEVAGFELALVLEGNVEVAATVSDAAAERIPPGGLVRARGTVPASFDIRLVSSSGGARIVTWGADATTRAFAMAPWIDDQLKATGNRVQALVGATLGPIAERLDESLRTEFTSRLAVRALMPGELYVEEGKPVSTMTLVGAGELLVGDEAVGFGNFLFPNETLQAGKAPSSARAGEHGAIVLFADRTVAQELLVTCPPLLEIFAGM